MKHTKSLAGGGTVNGVLVVNPYGTAIQGWGVAGVSPAAMGMVASGSTLQLTAGGNDAIIQLRDFNGQVYLQANGTGVEVYERLLTNQGSDVASASDITLGAGNYFDITGTTQIDTIASTGWTIGSFVVLQFDASVTVKHNTAGTGASLQLAGSGDFSATAGDTLMLVYDGTDWREVSRTVI